MELKMILRKLYGSVTDINGNPIEGADIEIKDDHFETRYQTKSQADGSFCIAVPPAVYPFITCVKNYAVDNLEYWCQNMDLTQDAQLDIRIDKLEVYGVHPFRVKGAYNAFLIYFRPMSLYRFIMHKQDICPDISRIEVEINGLPATVMLNNQVKEGFCDESHAMQSLTAFLIQVENPSDTKEIHRVTIRIWDQEGHFGMADYFPE